MRQSATTRLFRGPLDSAVTSVPDDVERVLDVLLGHLPGRHRSIAVVPLRECRAHGHDGSGCLMRPVRREGTVSNTGLYPTPGEPAPASASAQQRLERATHRTLDELEVGEGDTLGDVGLPVDVRLEQGSVVVLGELVDV